MRSRIFVTLFHAGFSVLRRPLLYLMPIGPLLLLIACGFSVQGSSEADATIDGGPSRPIDGEVISPIDDSGSSGSSGSSGTTIPDDASSDATISGNCTLIFEDTFTTQNANWDRLGSAQFQNGHVSLTQKNAGTQAGAIWWKSQLTFTGYLRVAVDVAFDAIGVTPADGLGIGWVSSPYVLGETGQNFGLCASGMNGFAVAADTLDGKLLLIASINASCGTNNGVFPANAVGASNILAEIRADSLSGKFDTSAIHSRILTIPKTGYLGVAASTGNGTADHSITAIRVSNCQ